MYLKVKLAIAILFFALCLLCQASWLCALLFALYAVLFFLLSFLEKREDARRIDELIRYVTCAQDDLPLPAISRIAEGQLGILQSEIYKVVTLLREEYTLEKRQKTYMSDMLSDISHQFKTPLSAIRIMTDLLSEEGVTEEQRLDWASRIDAQTGRMSWLIQSLLTLAQLEAGVLEMKAEPIYLPDLLVKVRQDLEVMAEVSGVSLEVLLPCASSPAEDAPIRHGPDAPSPLLVISGDSRWLSEAFTNIIKNAIEHSREGGHVRIRALGNTLYAAVVIEDDGEGIDPVHLPHIFERFYKAGSRREEGIGIGLSLARQIILKSHGTIKAESTPGEGTRFTVRFYPPQ